MKQIRRKLRVQVAVLNQLEVEERRDKWVNRMKHQKPMKQLKVRKARRKSRAEAEAKEEEAVDQKLEQ